MNKKASFSDVLFYIVAIVVVAVVFIISWVIMSHLNDNFQNSNTLSKEGKNIFSSMTSRFVSIVDMSFMIIVVGLIIGIVVGAYLVRIHPALFWVSIPVMAFFIFLASIFGNFFYSFSRSSEIYPKYSEFSILPFVMEHFVVFITGLVLLVAIALFAKNNSNEPQLLKK